MEGIVFEDVRSKVLQLLTSEEWRDCLLLFESPYAGHHHQRQSQQQQQQQDQGEEVCTSSNPSHSDSATQLPPSGRSRQSHQKGTSCTPGECPASAGASGQSLSWLSGREAVQAMLIANAHYYSTTNSWQAVLQPKPLGATSSSAHSSIPNLVAVAGPSCTAVPVAEPLTAAAVRRQYRRAAALVHPDKCRLPHAESAFKLVARAQQMLLRDVGDKDGEELPSGLSVWEEEENEESLQGFRWWDVWEERAAAVPKPLHMAHSTVPGTEDEEPHLWAITVQELRQEVAERQRAILTPMAVKQQPGPAPGPQAGPGQESRPSCGGAPAPTPAPLSLHQRQKRLKYARTVLAQRLSGAGPPAALAEAVAGAAGGVWAAAAAEGQSSGQLGLGDSNVGLRNAQFPHLASSTHSAGRSRPPFHPPGSEDADPVGAVSSTWGSQGLGAGRVGAFNGHVSGRVDMGKGHGYGHDGHGHGHENVGLLYGESLQSDHRYKYSQAGGFLPSGPSGHGAGQMGSTRLDSWEQSSMFVPQPGLPGDRHLGDGTDAADTPATKRHRWQ